MYLPLTDLVLLFVAGLALLQQTGDGAGPAVSLEALTPQRNDPLTFHSLKGKGHALGGLLSPVCVMRVFRYILTCLFQHEQTPTLR